MKRWSCLLTLAFFLAPNVAVQAQAKHPSLRTVATIDLPGPAGKRFDYLTVDEEDHYLLSGHLGAGILYVIDMTNNKVIAAIPDVDIHQEVLFAEDGRSTCASQWRLTGTITGRLPGSPLSPTGDRVEYTGRLSSPSPATRSATSASTRTWWPCSVRSA